MRFAPFYEASSPTPTCSSAKRRTRHSTALGRHQHAAVDAGFDHHFGHQRADRRLSKTSEYFHRLNLPVATPIPIVPVTRRLMCICMRTMVENWGNEGPAYSNGPATATLSATRHTTANGRLSLWRAAHVRPLPQVSQPGSTWALFPGVYGNGNSWLFRALKFNDFELSNAIAAVRSIATSKPITSTTAAASSSACPSPKPYQLWLICSLQPPLTGAS